MYKINLGYDNVLITIKNKEEVFGRIFSIPGFEQGDYYHNYLRHDPGPEHIFNYTKNEVEEKYDVKFPITLEYGDYSKFSKEFLETGMTSLSTDISLLKRLLKVDVQENTVEQFLITGENFIYPYMVNNEMYFEKEIPLPPDSVIDAAKKGKCKIVFFYGNEGHTYSYNKIKPVVEFTKKIDCLVYFYSSNLKLKEAYDKWKTMFSEGTTDKLIFPQYAAFEIDPWFINLDKTNNEQVGNYIYKYDELANEHRIVKDIINPNGLKKFLVFNRRPRLFRSFMHAAIKSNRSLDYNCYTGIEKNNTFNSTLTLRNELCAKVNRGAQIYEYLLNNKEKYSTEGYELDEDLNFNLAFNFPSSFFYNTIISVVTETETFKDCIFFSEKIFKPIYGLHPFILMGNAYSLKKLKEFGYKTFSDYWDETYDDIEDPFTRFNFVLNIIENLNDKPIGELVEMYKDMIPILKYNYLHFFQNQRHNDYLTALTTF